jgi:hypothetical protein
MILVFQDMVNMSMDIVHISYGMDKVYVDMVNVIRDMSHMYHRAW